MKDYIQLFKGQLSDFLKAGKSEQNFIFYVIYKDTVKKFIIDFRTKRFNYIVNTVLYNCLLMALDNDCDLEDLTITKKGELIIL